MTEEHQTRDGAAEQEPPAHLGDDLLRKGLAEDPDYRGEHPEPRFFITDESEDDFGGRIMTLNPGPQHPATHGVMKILLRADGEMVTAAQPHLGFLHRCAEKIGENVEWLQYLPYTDRYDYLSSMNNNLGYSMAVEKVLEVEIPKRAQFLRMICVELNRIASHLVAFGTYGLDLGAITPFLYAFRVCVSKCSS